MHCRQLWNREANASCAIGLAILTIGWSALHTTAAPPIDSPPDALNVTPLIRTGLLCIGPVPGLTTAWHVAPQTTGFPEGVAASFKVAAAPAATVTWVGAKETARDQFWSYALCPPMREGIHLVESSVSEGADGEPMACVCTLTVIGGSPPALTSGVIGVDLDPLPPLDLMPVEDANAIAVALYFGPSIAQIVPVSAGHHATSVDRVVPMTAPGLAPAAFAPLIEWRLDGVAHSLGPQTKLAVSRPGQHVVQAGPPSAPAQHLLTTWRTSLVLPSEPKALQSDVPLLCLAKTDPAGFEGQITWLAATKYGQSKPMLGKGTLFAAEFADTFGPWPGGGEWEWFGVKADNASMGKDVKRAVDIDVDTDRDGPIEDVDDEDGEDKWTPTRGAFYFVNNDDDDADKKSDSAEYDKDEKVKIIDTKINNGLDIADITPIKIRPFGDLTGKKVLLSVANIEQIKAIHVFEKIASQQEKFWGGPAETATEVDITAKVSATEDTTFGIEGLKYRLVADGVAGLTADMLFDGFVQFKLRCVEIATGLDSAPPDDVLLKVAPYIMLPNSQPSEKIIYMDHALNAAFQAKFVAALGAGHIVTYTTDTQWTQDDCEIGFSQTPLTSARVAAYTRHHGSQDEVVGNKGDAKFLRNEFIASGHGIYRNPHNPTPGAGFFDHDYGGNIELVPPTTHHKLGQICLGKDTSAKKKRFLKSQQVQAPLVELETKWLSVGHVDEFVSFWKPAAGTEKVTVILASTAKAYAIVDAAAIPSPGDPGDEDPGTFFAFGARETGEADLAGSNTLHDPTKNFSGSEPYEWVRIYEGPGQGNVAHISQLAGSMIVVDQVWAPFEPTDHLFRPTAPPIHSRGDEQVYYDPATGAVWFPDSLGSLPGIGSKYILVESTAFWEGPISPLAGFPPGKTPACCTIKEVKNKFAKMRAVNGKIQDQINAAKATLTAAIADPVTYIEVPVIYTGRLTPGGALVDHSCLAWTPGAANIQYGKDKLFIAEQVADKNGAELFGPSIIATLGFAPEFVDGLDLYHLQSGEVHCGSNAIRAIFSFKWWENQPAGVPNLP